MSNEEYQILAYDEEDGMWFAVILHLTNNQPVKVYRVPSDPPLSEPLGNIPVEDNNEQIY